MLDFKVKRFVGIIFHKIVIFTSHDKDLLQISDMQIKL